MRALTIGSAVLVLAVGATASGTHAATRPYPAGSFILDVTEVEATADSISGKNSAFAKMTGRVRKADAEEYCGRDPDNATISHDGAETKAQCVKDQLKQQAGKTYRASAGCEKKTIVSTRGKFAYAGGWRGDDGQVLDGSNASGAPVIDAQFAALCPRSRKP